MRRRARLAIALCPFVAASSLWSGSCRAEAAPDEWRSATYYSLNAGLSAAFVGGSALAYLLLVDVPGPDSQWFPGDLGLRGTCSPAAAHLSDMALVLAISTPPSVELGAGLGPRFVNAQVVYTQSLFANLLLNSLVKVAFRRPRPYSYAQAGTCGFALERYDAHVSFYSGHASTAFAAALAGSWLISEGELDERASAALWGTEFALAAAAANLRARAGKHYYSDIVVGAVIGAGVGIGVPLLHGAERAPRATDWAAGAIGLVLGVLGSQLVALGAEAVLGTDVGWVIGPLPGAGRRGLVASGRW